jgi:asparagine synthase (glutamine-hydrolysing)
MKGNAEGLKATVEAMASSLTHRGPDASGSWVEESAGIAFGHRRLSVIDLSAEGAQPMASTDGRYVISYNGEIYNHARLRTELEKSIRAHFRGHSDTEVMLEAIRQWGLLKAVRQFNGIFAFSLWDAKERKLFLVRDHLGVKPLYYGMSGSRFLFASELKALRAAAGFANRVDRNALALFMRYAYIESPHTIYQGIRKLPAGCILVVDPANPEVAIPTHYWSVRETAETGAMGKRAIRPEDALERLETLLRDSVWLQMVSDVPLGAFLSGGTDSSLVVSLMQKAGASRVKTFTIGFAEAGFDESAEARKVAEHLGTDHTGAVITPADAMAVIPGLPDIYDEPFADPSQIPTFLVSKFAREKVTVALSGDGGDELFGGYQKYRWAEKLWKLARPFPGFLRRIAAAGITAVPPGAWDAAIRAFGPLVPRDIRYGSPGYRVHKTARVLAGRTPQEMYRNLMSHWTDTLRLVPGSVESPVLYDLVTGWPKGLTTTEWMMFADASSYLPDDGFVKVDRASMACGLEVRVPILDHRIAEFAWTLPPSLRIRNGEGKWMLKTLLHRHVPRGLVDRPKMGFAVPVGEWVRGPLRDWAESLLAEDRLRREGYLDPAVVRAEWERHLKSGDRQFQVWNVLMFQAWLEKTRP